MGKSISYFDLAENDYQFLVQDYRSGRVGNILCSSAQNICERYLKHVIDVECMHIDTTSILHSHSLKVLRNFIKTNSLDFDCDWNKVLKADGYYFSTRYPGDDAFIVTREDVEECWEAVEYVREVIKDRYPDCALTNMDII